jgi:hypothetical protein
MFDSPQAFDSFAAFDMSTANPDLDDLMKSTEPGDAETQLKCRFPDCSEEREFPTESALRFDILPCISYGTSHHSANIKTSTASPMSVVFQTASTLNSAIKEVWSGIHGRYTEPRPTVAPSPHASVTRKVSLANTICSSIRNGVILVNHLVFH